MPSAVLLCGAATYLQPKAEATNLEAFRTDHNRKPTTTGTQPCFYSTFTLLIHLAKKKLKTVLFPLFIIWLINPLQLLYIISWQIILYLQKKRAKQANYFDLFVRLYYSKC